MFARQSSPATLDDRFHPVMVRELRQAVRARGVQWLLSVYLLGQIGWLGVVLFSERDPRDLVGAGAWCATGQMTILGLTAAVGVPLYAAGRLTGELRDGSLDLLRLTGIGFGSLVNGKIKSSLVLYLLIMSVSLPFATISFLLRGVGWDAVLVAALYNLAVVVSCLPYWMSAALLPRSLVQGVLTLLTFGTWHVVIIGQVVLTNTWLLRDIGAIPLVGSFLWLLFTVAAPAAVAFGVAARRVEGFDRPYVHYRPPAPPASRVAPVSEPTYRNRRAEETAS